jgi:hypothetical protein
MANPNRPHTSDQAKRLPGPKLYNGSGVCPERKFGRQRGAGSPQLAGEREVGVRRFDIPGPRCSARPFCTTSYPSRTCQKQIYLLASSEPSHFPGNHQTWQKQKEKSRPRFALGASRTPIPGPTGPTHVSPSSTQSRQSHIIYLPTYLPSPM